jgi:hypothetical protein
MPHVTTAGTRAGSSGVGGPASGAALGVESLGDSTVVSEGSASLLDVESLGDSPSRAEPFDRFSAPLFDRESLGDSAPSGDSEGALGDPEGLACGDEDGVDPPVLPLDPPPVVGDGLEVGEGPDEPEPPDDPEPPDGLAVGEGEDGLDVGVGDWVGDGDGLVDVRVTGGATAGGTLPPAGRSCCQDHPTEPPAGTVSDPTPEDEYVHEAFEPSAHQSPQ